MVFNYYVLGNFKHNLLESKMKTKFIRIKYSSYLKLRKLYPALYKESMSSYFERLQKWLAGVMIEWDGYDAA